MKKDDLENLTHTGHIESRKKNKGKQRVRYLTSLCDWLAEQGQRDVEKRPEVTFSNKRLEVGESYDHQCPKVSWHIKENIFVFCTILRLSFLFIVLDGFLFHSDILHRRLIRLSLSLFPEHPHTYIHTCITKEVYITPCNRFHILLISKLRKNAMTSSDT